MNVAAQKTPLKLISLGFLLLALGTLNPTSASIVFQTNVSILGTPGHTLEILAIANTGVESGCVGWTGSASQAGKDGFACPDGRGTIAGGHETNVGSKTLTRTIGEVGALATNGAEDLAILFNGNESGGGTNPSVVIEELVVMFYSPTGTLLYKAWLPTPFPITDVAGGQGGAGFLFRLDYAQSAQAQLLAFSGTGFENNRIGLAATVSDASSGAEVFYVSTGSFYDEPPIPVPEPVSYLTVGAGLFGIALLLRRRRNGRK